MAAPTLTPRYVWFLIAVLGIGTFAIRLSFIQLFGRFDDVPPRVQRVLEFVPVAVLAAIVVPRLVFVDGQLALWPANEQLIAGCVAAVVAWRTENMLAVLGVGMGTLWLLTVLVP